MLLAVFLLYAIQTAITIDIWQGVAGAFNQLHGDRLLNFSEDEKCRLVVKYNRLFNTPVVNLLGFIGSLAVTYRLSRNGRMDVLWWGGREGGLLGVLSLWWISCLVWYQIIVFNLKGWATFLFAREVLSRERLRTVPFHCDGMYGLAGIADLLLSAFWSGTVSLIATVVVLYSGLVSVHRGVLAFVLVTILVVFFPTFVVWPAFRIRDTVRAMKRQLLSDLDAQVGAKGAEVEAMANCFTLRREICRLPELPFQWTTLMFTVLVYVAQFAGTAAAVYSIFYH